MIIEGRALVLRGDDIDTDRLYPGSYLNVLDPEEMKLHLFEGLDQPVEGEPGEGTILVVGKNFGTGSSREHVQVAMRALGIRGVIGESFARIFYRNCVNLGMAIVSVPGALGSISQGGVLRIDTGEGIVESGGQSYAVRPVPALITEIVNRGGLVPWVRSRLAPPDETVGR